VHSPAAVFLRPRGRSFPATGEQFRVIPGGMSGIVGRLHFGQGVLGPGRLLQGAAAEGVIRCAWHGSLHGPPGTARVAGARARGQAGPGKSQGAKLR